MMICVTGNLKPAPLKAKLSSPSSQSGEKGLNFQGSQFSEKIWIDRLSGCIANPDEKATEADQSRSQWGITGFCGRSPDPLGNGKQRLELLSSRFGQHLEALLNLE